MLVARSLAALAVGVALDRISAARADDYPSRPITLILPLGAGGAMDILARAQFEPKLKERLGKPIVIENRTGGGTVIAATAVAKAPPDGYTLFFVPAGTLTTNATLYKKLPYDPAQGFHAGRADLVGGLRAGGASVAAGAFDEGAGAIRQGAARPAVVRLDRHRRHAASRGRDVHARIGRPEDDARALSRHAAGGERRGRQSRADGVRRSGRRAAADQATASSARSRCRRGCASARCRTCRPWRRRASRATRRCRGT